MAWAQGRWLTWDPVERSEAVSSWLSFRGREETWRAGSAARGEKEESVRISAQFQLPSCSAFSQETTMVPCGTEAIFFWLAIKTFYTRGPHTYPVLSLPLKTPGSLLWLSSQDSPAADWGWDHSPRKDALCPAKVRPHHLEEYPQAHMFHEAEAPPRAQGLSSFKVQTHQLGVLVQGSFCLKGNGVVPISCVSD